MNTQAERSFTIRQIGEVVSDYAGDDEDANGRFPGVVLAGDHEAVRAAARFLLDRVVIVPLSRHDELVAALKNARGSLVDIDDRLEKCGPLHTAEDAYDSSYKGMVADAILDIDAALRKAEGAE